MDAIIQQVNKKYMKKQIMDVMTGDIVRVSQKIKEGGKIRIQNFEGVVIERAGGNGINASITVRRIASGVGVEKKFFLHNPNIEKIKVLRSSKVRRKKIFYLRGLSGKAAKLKEKQRKILEEIGEEIKEEKEDVEQEKKDIGEQETEEENQEVRSKNQEDESIEQKIKEKEKQGTNILSAQQVDKDQRENVTEETDSKKEEVKVEKEKDN